MRRFWRSSFAQSFLLPFALTVWLSACYKWVPLRPPTVELPAQASKPVEDRDELRLHVGQSGKVEGTLAELTQDSVVLVDDGARVTLALESVSHVDARRFNLTGTVILVGGVIVVIGAGLAFIVADIAERR